MTAHFAFTYIWWNSFRYKNPQRAKNPRAAAEKKSADHSLNTKKTQREHTMQIIVWLMESDFISLYPLHRLHMTLKVLHIPYL